VLFKFVVDDIPYLLGLGGCASNTCRGFRQPNILPFVSPYLGTLYILTRSKRNSSVWKFIGCRCPKAYQSKCTCDKGLRLNYSYIIFAICWSNWTRTSTAEGIFRMTDLRDHNSKYESQEHTFERKGGALHCQQYWLHIPA
jgi:hypothetical protein